MASIMLWNGAVQHLIKEIFKYDGLFLQPFLTQQLFGLNYTYCYVKTCNGQTIEDCYFICFEFSFKWVTFRITIPDDLGILVAKYWSKIQNPRDCFYIFIFMVTLLTKALIDILSFRKTSKSPLGTSLLVRGC